MTTTRSASKAKKDDPSIAPTLYFATILVIVFVISVIGLQAYFGRVASEEEVKKHAHPASPALVKLREEQQARLAAYRWVSADSGVVAIPIDRAMSLVAQDLARAAGETPEASRAPSPARN